MFFIYVVEWWGYRCLLYYFYVFLYVWNILLRIFKRKRKEVFGVKIKEVVLGKIEGGGRSKGRIFVA